MLNVLHLIGELALKLLKQLLQSLDISWKQTFRIFCENEALSTQCKVRWQDLRRVCSGFHDNGHGSTVQCTDLIFSKEINQRTGRFWFQIFVD